MTGPRESWQVFALRWFILVTFAAGLSLLLPGFCFSLSHRFGYDLTRTPPPGQNRELCLVEGIRYFRKREADGKVYCEACIGWDGAVRQLSPTGPPEQTRGSSSGGE